MKLPTLRKARSPLLLTVPFLTAVDIAATFAEVSTPLLTENPDVEAQVRGAYPPLDRPTAGGLAAGRPAVGRPAVGGPTVGGSMSVSPLPPLGDALQESLLETSLPEAGLPPEGLPQGRIPQGSSLQGSSPQGEALPLGALQHAWDHAGPQAGVYQVVYHSREVIRLRCREMMATTLVFPAWERLETIRLGDPDAFKVETPQPHILVLQPQEFVGIDTSLTVLGASGKVYTFYVRAEGYNTHQVTDLTVYIRVPKPTSRTSEGPQQGSLQKEAATDYLEEVPFHPEALTFAFDMAGDPTIAPERVYSDGIRTWFDYGVSLPYQDLPVIYRVVDGVDTPLNVTRQGTKLVAQGAGAFTLISGQKVVCVTPSPEGRP